MYIYCMCPYFKKKGALVKMILKIFMMHIMYKTFYIKGKLFSMKFHLSISPENCT